MNSLRKDRRIQLLCGWAFHRSLAKKTTIPEEIITENRVADFYFFELIKSLKFVIWCRTNVFELVKTVMDINTLRCNLLFR